MLYFWLFRRFKNVKEILAVNVPTVILSFCKEKKSKLRHHPFQNRPSCGTQPPPLTTLPTTPASYSYPYLPHTWKDVIANVPTKEKNLSGVFRPCHQITLSAFEVRGCRCECWRRENHILCGRAGRFSPSLAAPVCTTEATWPGSGAPVSKVSQPNNGMIPASRLLGQGPSPSVPQPSQSRRCLYLGEAKRLDMTGHLGPISQYSWSSDRG